MKERAADRRQRERRTKALLKTGRLLEVILSHVRNGGSLISLCEAWGVRYSDFIGWIRADNKRSEAYNLAGQDRSEWTKEMILSELRLLSRFDIRKLYDADGNLKPIQELDDETARMVASTEIDELFSGKGDFRTKSGQTTKVKVYDKLKALELVAKTEHEIGASLEDLLSKSYEPGPAQEPNAGKQEGAQA